MPISVSRTTGKTAYHSALIGNYETLHVKVDVSALTNKEIDAQGFLKPGVPLSLAGILLTGAAGEVPCVSIEPIKVAASNSNADIAAITNDPFVALAVNGVLNRDIMEDNLDRVLSVAEIAALNGPNSKLVLSLT
jgi:hypothetical protein